MKDIGKHFLAATASGCRQWHHLMCSKGNLIVFWRMHECVGDELREAGMRREEEDLYACVASCIINSGNVQWLQAKLR